MKIAGSPVYLDTSALAKLYVPEPGSEELDRAMSGRRDLVVADLAFTELTSALARRVREGQLGEADARRLDRKVSADVREGMFDVLDLTPDTHPQAERFLLTLGRSVALRAADVVHLALAVGAGAVALLTFDQTLATAARVLGTLELPEMG